MSKLEPRIEAVRQKYDLSHDDFWQIKQNGQWVCKHAALEIVAAKASVEWLPPVIIEKDAPNLVTSMIVTGKMGDRVEWATGETNATNYKVVGKQPAYPWAMSEKRAKDRVVLKLVGIHGLVYSEDELSDTSPEKSANVPSPTGDPDPATGAASEAVESLWTELSNIRSAGGLKSFWLDNSKSIGRMDPANRKRFTDRKEAMKADFDKPQDPAGDRFPGDTDITNTAGRRLHTMEGV